MQVLTWSGLAGEAAVGVQAGAPRLRRCQKRVRLLDQLSVLVGPPSTGVASEAGGGSANLVRLRATCAVCSRQASIDNRCVGRTSTAQFGRYVIDSHH